MNGLMLSRRYYSEVFLPECRKRLPPAEGHFAAGLVGEGSECFGYDDDWSRDHSFGLRLCIWLTEEDYARFGADMEALWHSLPQPFWGYTRPADDRNEGKRSGVFTVGGFYRGLLSVSDIPKQPLHWLSIAEPRLAAATNGVVYIDEPGEFTAVRNRFLAHFPEDVTRYYLARYAAIAAQTGQYNLLRAARRGDGLAVENIRACFIQSIISMVFLLNRTYRPFYKCAPKAMCTLPILGNEVHGKLLRLSEARGIREQVLLVEDVCAHLLEEMRRQGYTDGRSAYLMSHLPEIMGRIKTPEIRNLGIDLVF